MCSTNLSDFEDDTCVLPLLTQFQDVSLNHLHASNHILVVLYQVLSFLIIPVQIQWFSPDDTVEMRQ